MSLSKLDISSHELNLVPKLGVHDEILDVVLK
jgi:hypothetical protein